MLETSVMINGCNRFDRYNNPDYWSEAFRISSSNGRLFIENRVNINDRPLIQSAKYGHLRIVKYIFQNGALKYSKDNENIYAF